MQSIFHALRDSSLYIILGAIHLVGTFSISGTTPGFHALKNSHPYYLPLRHYVLANVLTKWILTFTTALLWPQLGVGPKQSRPSQIISLKII
jgi:hypothetical protein